MTNSGTEQAQMHVQKQGHTRICLPSHTSYQHPSLQRQNSSLPVKMKHLFVYFLAPPVLWALWNLFPSAGCVIFRSRCQSIFPKHTSWEAQTKTKMQTQQQDFRGYGSVVMWGFKRGGMLKCSSSRRRGYHRGLLCRVLGDTLLPHQLERYIPKSAEGNHGRSIKKEQQSAVQPGRERPLAWRHSSG